MRALEANPSWMDGGTFGSDVCVLLCACVCMCAFVHIFMCVRARVWRQGYHGGATDSYGMYSGAGGMTADSNRCVSVPC